MFIYAQLNPATDRVDVEFAEIAFPEKQYQLKNLRLREGDGTFVILKEGKLEVAGSN